MNGYRLVKKCAVAMAFSIAAIAANAQQWLDSSTSATPISGYRGQQDARIVTSNDEALYGLEWTETQDRPCRLVLLSRNIRRGGLVRPASYQFDICAGIAQPVRYVPPPEGNAAEEIPLPGFTIGGESESSRRVEFAQNRIFMRGVRVCANRGNHRLKGIELFGGRILAKSWDVRPPNENESAQFFNCGNRDWRDSRYCPDGKVAVGVIVQYETLFITGLRLVCGEIK